MDNTTVFFIILGAIQFTSLVTHFLFKLEEGSKK